MKIAERCFSLLIFFFFFFFFASPQLSAIRFALSWYLFGLRLYSAATNSPKIAVTSLRNTFYHGSALCSSTEAWHTELMCGSTLLLLFFWHSIRFSTLNENARKVENWSSSVFRIACSARTWSFCNLLVEKCTNPPPHKPLKAVSPTNISPNFKNAGHPLKSVQVL